MTFGGEIKTMEITLYTVAAGAGRAHGHCPPNSKRGKTGETNIIHFLK
jgi:hypothetical protein